MYFWGQKARNRVASPSTDLLINLFHYPPAPSDLLGLAVAFSYDASNGSSRSAAGLSCRYPSPWPKIAADQLSYTEPQKEKKKGNPVLQPNGLAYYVGVRRLRLLCHGDTCLLITWL